MRKQLTGILAVLFICLACSGSGSPADDGTANRTPPATPTPRPVDVLEAQATALCTAAFAAPAPATAQAARRPAVLYWRRDESKVQTQSRSSTAGPGWRGELAGDLPQTLSARTAEEVQTVACREERYIQVGVYQESNSAAVRIDYELRLLRWPGGELLAARTFRGGDPPATRTTQGSVSWEHGPRPQAEATAWLEQSLQAGP